jgi:hypothetical protein
MDWRIHLDDQAASIRYLHGLAARSDTDVFAELVLEYLEANGLHRRNVASGSYFVNSQEKSNE